MNRLTRWLDARRHPGEYPLQRARRLYLEELRQREPAPTKYERPVPWPPHELCHTDHRPWEACPATPPQLRLISTPTVYSPADVPTSAGGSTAAADDPTDTEGDPA